MERVWRSTINPHPKNPRVITESAKKKLKSKMAEVGLLQPLIINRTTGYLLGGHQRMASMDALEKYKDGKNDYQIDVAFVELEEKAEMEMLVFLNNASAQGGWNLDTLADIGKDLGDFESMGFDSMDITLMFDGDSRFDPVFQESLEVEEAKDNLKEIKEVRKNSVGEMNNTQSEEFYIIVVCKDKAEKVSILNRAKVAPYEKFISSETLMAMING